jgi:hypothetical protein
MAPNWLGSMTSRTAGATYNFTTNCSATLEIAGVREMGLRWLLTSSTGLCFDTWITSANFQEEGNLD